MPKDLLNFDACNHCKCLAIDPRVLSCGHSCCKTCIVVDTTLCPVQGCLAEHDPSWSPSREELPQNWLISEFFTQNTKCCQICAEEGTQRPATHQCHTCAKTTNPVVEFFCESCYSSGHASRLTRGHVGGSFVDLIEMECSKHNLPKTIFCVDDRQFICTKCHMSGHKAHETKLVETYEAMREALGEALSPLLDMTPFYTEEDRLFQSRERKKSKIDILQKKIELIDSKIQVSQSPL